VGLIDLFFREVERAEQNPSLLQAPPQPKAMLVSIYGEFVKTKEALAAAKDWVWGTASSIKNYTVNLFQSENLPVAGGPAGLVSSDDLNFEDEQMIEPVFLSPSVAPNPLPVFVEQVSAPAVSPNIIQTVQSPVQPPVQAVLTQSLAQPQLAFSIDLIPAPLGAGGTSSFQSLAEEQPETIATTTTATTTPPVEPTPTPSPSPEPPPADTTPPVMIFEILECVNSFSTNGCLLATTTLNLVWQSDDDELDFYEISVNLMTSTTTATSTAVLVLDNFVNDFSARAKDMAGNWSDPIILSVEIFTIPVIINEIAWAGSVAGLDDEWLELYNKTGQDVSLENWVLRSADSRPFINLSGVIPANGYYLLERTDDEAISDISADLVYGNNGNDWSLNNSGEILILEKASTTIDKTILKSAGANKWPGGNSSAKTSMERYSPDEPGDVLGSWASNDTYISRGTAVDGISKIYGTPKARNSVNHYINKEQNIIADFTLQKSLSPYFVNNSILGIDAGAVLTIEPGVVIKFRDNAGIISGGKIMARGTDAEPIVFTAFTDDEYGGDLNGDATSTAPVPASWQGVGFSFGGDNDSVFENTIFRYGGLYYSSSQFKAVLETQVPVLSVSDSVFEKSYIYAVKLVDSDSVFSGNIFRENNNAPDSAGINVAFYALGGSPTVENNNFVFI